MGRLADQLISALPSETGTTSPQSETSKYAADPKGALTDPGFLNLLRQHYTERGLNGVAAMSDEALVDYFYTDRNRADLNTLRAIVDAGRAVSASPETRANMLAIQEVWEGLPNMFQEGGRGWAALADVAQPLILDPVNLFGGAIGKGVGQGVARSAQAGGQMALRQAVKRGTLRGAGAAALSEGAINAGAEGVIDTALQARDVAIGLQDEYDPGRTGMAMGLGGLLGGVAGGAISAPSAYIGARKGAQQAADLSNFTTGTGERMFPGEEVARMTNAQADAITGSPERLGEAVSRRSTEFETLRAQADAERVAAEEKATPPTPFLERAMTSVRNEIDEMRADGVDTDLIEEVSRRRAALARLVPFSQRLQGEREAIVALEASEDEAKRALGAQRRAQFEKDYDEFRSLTKDGDEGDIKAAIARWNEQFPPAKPTEETPAAQPAATQSAATQPKAAQAPAEGAPQAAEPAPAPEAAVPVEDAAPEREIIASDKVRTLAEERSIDITALTGSGKGGRIVMGDVRRAAKAAEAEAVQPETVAAAPERGTTSPLEAERPSIAGKPTRAESVVRSERADRVSRDVRRQAMAKGVDYAEAVEIHPGLAPDAAVKRTMRERFRANKTGEGIPEDLRIARLQNAVTEITSMARTEKLATLGDFEALVSRMAASDRYADLGGDLVDYFDIVLSKAQDAGQLYDDIASLGLNTTEMTRLKRIQRQLQKADPDLSSYDAEQQAARQLLAQRAEDPTATRASAGKYPSAGDRIERGSIFTFAGRNGSGKIQGFLRQSSPISKGSDYGIGGDVAYPRRDRLAFEEAQLRAKQGQGKAGVYQFVADAPMLANAPGKGRVRVPAGTTLFTDATHRIPYTSEAQLRHVMPKEYRTASQFPEPAASEAEKIYPGGPRKADVEADIALDRAVAEGETVAGEGPGLPDIQPPDDTRNAILIYSPSKGYFRMQGVAQIEAGTNLKGLLGAKGGGTDDWLVTHVPVHRKPKGKGDAAYRKLWEEFGADAKPIAEFDPDVRKSFAGDPFTPEGPPPLRWEEAESVVTDALTVEDITPINRAFGQSRFKPGQAVSYGRIVEAILDLETISWPDGSVERNIAGLARLHAISARTVPEGHIGNVASRVKAHEDLDRVLIRYTPEEIAEAKRLVDRMSVRKDVAPVFAATDTGSSYFSPLPDRNMVTFSRLYDDPKRSVAIPRMHIVVHEMAHWAYMNVLTPQDRLEFWNIMEANYAGNRSAIDNARAIPGMSKMVKADRKTWDMPQELFADQFAMYWAKVDEGSTLRAAPFWQKIAKYIKGIFDRYVSGKAIDPDLEPIFARILPDDIEAEKFRSTITGTEAAENKAQQVYRSYLSSLQFHREEIEDAISRGGPDGIVNAHVEMLRYLNAIAPRQKGKLTDLAAGEIDPKVLAPIRKLVPIIRNRQKDIFEILRISKVDYSEPVEGIEADEMFDSIINMRKSAEAAEILGRFYGEGYASFTPEAGIPAKITSIESTSTQALLDMVFNALEGVYMRVNPENLYKVPPGISKPASAKARVARKPGQPVTTRGQRAAQTKVSRSQAKLDRDIQDVVTRGRDAYEYLRSVDADDSVTFANLNGLSEQQLYNRIKKSTDSGSPDYAAIFRLNEILNTRDLPKTPRSVPAKVKDMKARDLERHLYDALVNGEGDYARDVAYEITRRSLGGAKAGYKPVIKGKSAKVFHLIDTELAEFNGEADRLGIPPRAGPDVREFLTFLNHRSPETTYTTRKLAYRVLNLAQRSDDGSPPHADAGVLDRLAGSTSWSPTNAIDYRGEAFNAVRADLRRLSGDLTKGNRPADSVIEDVLSLGLRGGLLEEPHDRAISAIYRRRFDGDADAAHGWFAREMLPHLRGESGVEDTLNRLTGGREPVGDHEIDALFDAVSSTRESLAYMLNGLIRRSDIKDRYFPVTLYGDMFQAERMPPFADGVRRPAIASDLAVAYANDAYAGASAARRKTISRFISTGVGAREDGRPITYYHGTPNGKAYNRNTNPDMMLQMSRDGNYGPGFYLSRDPLPPGEVYATRGTPGALRKKFEMANPDASEELVEEFEIEMLNLGDMRNMLAKKRRDYSITAMEDGDPDRLVRLRQDIDNMIAQEETYTEVLHDRFGVEFDPLVVPTYIRMTNPADFRLKTPTGDNMRFLAGLAADLVKRRNLTQENAERFIRSFIDEDPMSEAYSYLVELVGDTARDATAARSAITDSLRGLGYDGMLTTHRNTTSVDGTALATDGRTYASYQREYEVPVVFERKNVKHVDAAYFDKDDDRLFYWPDMEDTGKTTSAIMDGILSGKISSVAEISPSSVAAMVEGQGTSETGSLFMSLMRGRRLTGQERRALEALSPRGILKSQSQTMRDMGMNWMADRYQPVFQDITQDFAQRYMKVHNLLKGLPDADGWFRAWTRRLNPAHSRTQPESFTRIVRALRRPSESKSGTRAYNALTAQEKEVYATVRRLFQEERERLVHLGVSMGSRGPDYYPQVWNQANIVKDPEGFRSALIEYYRIEGEAADRAFDPNEAAEFATKVYARLADVDQEGVIHPMAAGMSRSSSAENVDFGRRIALDKPEHEAALKYLEPFMEDNLESVLTKYFDSTSRRAKLIEKFGVNAHGAYDYMEVAHEGAPAIARLLSTNKTFQRRSIVLGVDAKPEGTSFEVTIPMPFTGRAREAEQFAQELVRMHQGDGGSAGARAALEAVAPRNQTTGAVPVTYQRRMDAILGALDDFGGQPARMEREADSFVERSLAVAMKKHQPGVSRRGARASSIIRSVNSVALLGFTTLTSIPDIALPMIRASGLKQHATALRKMAQDPHYRRMILNTGVAIENLMHDRMLYGFGAPDTKVSSAFHNLTLLTPWTDMQRAIGGAVGVESFKAMQHKALDTFQRGLPYDQQTAQYRKAARFLTFYGLKDFLPDNVRGGESLSSEALLETDDQVRAAVVRFADHAIFAPNADDVPLWTQTPVGAMVFQLKSFPLLMMRMGKDVLDEARHGNAAPLAKYLTIGPMFGMAAHGVKDVVQARGGEDNREAALRERNWQTVANGLGFDVDNEEAGHNLAGWYIDGLMAMGGLGILGEVFYGIADQADNGAYGETRIVSLLGGPTAGLGLATVKVYAGITDGKESNAKERAAVREIATRVPIAGGVRKWRENTVDFLAGSQSDDTRDGAWEGGRWEGGDWK